MWSKLKLLFDLFRKGQEVANKETWKNVGNATTVLSAILVGLVEVARMFGYDVQITTEQAMSVAGGIATVVLWITHNITSKHAGILPAKPAQEPVPEPTGTAEANVSSIDEATRKRAQQWLDETYRG